MWVHAKASAARMILRLKQKGLRYWTSALVVFVLTIVGTKILYGYLQLHNKSAGYFQFLLDHGPRPSRPRFVTIVLIEDDEYWNGDPAGRAPLNRNYLARVVGSLVATNARVIALDVDARLPIPDSMTIPDAYKEETCNLIRAIKTGAEAGKKFVLATPISFNAHGGYRQDSDIYQANGLCERPHHEPPREEPCNVKFVAQDKDKITCGYIALPYDLLAIPGPIDMADGGELDSFALAVARAERPPLVDELVRRKGAEVRYSNFIPESGFEGVNARFSTTDVLEKKIDLHNGAVIVGANWSTFAVKRGPKIDLHPTPAGRMVGALLHANFAEALLDDRTVTGVPEWVLNGMEVVFGLAAAVIFALTVGLWRKLGAMFSLFLVLFLVQWFMLREFAIFFDAFFPVLSLGLHSLYERLFGMHGAAPPALAA
jgi:CHASE2 domain-containing sensor protein